MYTCKKLDIDFKLIHCIGGTYRDTLTIYTFLFITNDLSKISTKFFYNEKTLKHNRILDLSKYTIKFNKIFNLIYHFFEKNI